MAVSFPVRSIFGTTVARIETPRLSAPGAPIRRRATSVNLASAVSSGARTGRDVIATPERIGMASSEWANPGASAAERARAARDTMR
jgi:hypothetical protein